MDSARAVLKVDPASLIGGLVAGVVLWLVLQANAWLSTALESSLCVALVAGSARSLLPQLDRRLHQATAGLGGAACIAGGIHWISDGSNAAIGIAVAAAGLLSILAGLVERA